MARLLAKPPNTNHEPAKCLYLWVTTAMPESKALFRGEEIATDADGWQYFVDGWGNPIGFLRWAPGASAWSDIQMADPVNHHDPFDPMLTQNGSGSYAATAYQFPNPAYQLYPLIFRRRARHHFKTATDGYGITNPPDPPENTFRVSRPLRLVIRHRRLG